MMKQIIVITEDAQKEELFRRTARSDYSVNAGVALWNLIEYCRDPEKCVEGTILDAGMVSEDTVIQLRRIMGHPLFPIVVFGDELSESEQGKWIRSGASEVLSLPASEELVVSRLTNVIALYAMSKSLTGRSYDDLTGLYTRQAFYHFAEDMIREQPQAQYTLIISDIEEFKMINSRYGEEIGDALLRYVGKSLAAMNSKDILFARYGGDQFVGLLRHSGGTDMENEAPILGGMAMMKKYAPVENFEVKFGIYDEVDHELPISMMCDRALMAVRSIKHQYGRTLAKYNQRMQQQYLKEQQILECMEQALSEKQFQVYYQPKHSAQTEELIGAEALVRWIHPTYGFMSPGDFIPLFEKNGFISKLDHYVWEKVCEDLTKWKRLGLPVVSVSVNASRRDLLQPDFLKKIREPAERFGVDPRLVHMEITESVYMEDAELLAPIVREVQKLGIRIELDDFGAGFSSLGILSKLPIDVIKLDISFVRSLEQQEVVVESVIRMAHRLGFDVTAEGVETDDQLELLRKMNCDCIQGYYYSKPLPESGFKEYLGSYEKAE